MSEVGGRRSDGAMRFLIGGDERRDSFELTIRWRFRSRFGRPTDLGLCIGFLGFVVLFRRAFYFQLSRLRQGVVSLGDDQCASLMPSPSIWVSSPLRTSTLTVTL